MQEIEVNQELRKVLLLKLEESQAKNPSYSLRAFAKGLDVHASYLSEFFSGKRNLSEKVQKRIIENLNIDEQTKLKLLNSIDRSVVPEQALLDKDLYQLVADPIYYSLLCLVETKDFILDYTEISQKLNRTLSEVQVAFELLIRVGYLKFQDKKGKFEILTPHLTTSDDITNSSLRVRHNKNLEDAKEALFNVDVMNRYFRFETLAIDSNNFKQFKEVINDFFYKLILVSNLSNKKSDVFEFCFSYFPRTQINQETENKG